VTVTKRDPLVRAPAAKGRDAGLPSFKNPPVNETALSIQFAPIQNFGIPHYGLYWTRIRQNFTRFEVQAPLDTVTEPLDGSSRTQPRFGLQFLAIPDVRVWFVDSTGNRLIQLQRDRFIHNWRQLTGSEEYPRYESVRATLQTEWETFCTFLKSEKLGLPQVNQCEVIYVNHIEYGKGWSGHGELKKVIALWAGIGSGDFLPPPESVNMEVHYLLPDKLGRLHVSVAPVIRGRDSQEVLQVMLTARGAPKSSSFDDVFAWLDIGREWVVKGFTDFTTESMHKLWGRQS
jgi:uncharacterized protein (TIGR04255 family)